MGGYRALFLADTKPQSLCAVGGHSAALWRTDAETPPGAFDDAEDFARHDVPRLARRGAYAGLPVWLDVRSRDGFRNADLGFAKLLGTHGVKVRSSASPGAHETSYWDAHMRNYLRFYADALARCDAD